MGARSKLIQIAVSNPSVWNIHGPEAPITAINKEQIKGTWILFRVT